MSVSSIDHISEGSAQDGDDLEGVDTAAWPERSASLVRRFTPYVPRHRAAGPPA